MANKKSVEEWIKQARYDLETADGLFKIKRYIYCVFICHLALEKMLKGLYLTKTGKEPPKIHNLMYFVEKAKLNPPLNTEKFLVMLDEVSIPTRYPDELKKLLSVYNKERVQDILKTTHEVFPCLREELKKS